MDPLLLAESIAELIAPAMPALVQGGQELVARAGKELAAHPWEKIQALWRRLRPKIEERPDAAKAAQGVAQDPTDSLARDALQLQLLKILSQDRELATELVRVLADGEPRACYNAQVAGGGAVAQGSGATAVGERGILIGGVTPKSRGQRRDR